MDRNRSVFLCDRILIFLPFSPLLMSSKAKARNMRKRMCRCDGKMGATEEISTELIQSDPAALV
ncbi:hypothetical protein EMIT0373P_20333 [Pseudomonas chlororaphis]